MKNLLFWKNLWSNHNLPLISLMDLNICLVLRWPWLFSRIKLKFQKMKAVAFIAKKLAKNISKRTVNIVHNSNALRFNKGISNLKSLKPSKWGHPTVFEIDYWNLVQKPIFLLEPTLQSSRAGKNWFLDQVSVVYLKNCRMPPFWGL